jgi:hypothetical protein
MLVLLEILKPFKILFFNALIQLQVFILQILNSFHSDQLKFPPLFLFFVPHQLVFLVD